MKKEYFADKSSVVREIWGKSDTILFIFAGAAAEFALNKAVDWLYFTGRLPADPLGRLFSTVTYARQIVFAERNTALSAIDSIASIHKGVEAKRKHAIPDWAYRDVLFLLIDYSIRSFEILERKLTRAEKNEVFHVFNSVGHRMGLKDLPDSFEEWEVLRHTHLNEHLQRSTLTLDLFKQYRRHLGLIRYRILLEVHVLIVPVEVRQLLGLRSTSVLGVLLRIYRITKALKVDRIVRAIILPAKYMREVMALDKEPNPAAPS